ncbi:hypothetical protein [Oceanithermus sp.]
MKRPQRRFYVIVVETCPECNGDGYVPVDDGSGMINEAVCPVCEGTGELEDREELWKVLRGSRRAS